MLPPPQNDPTPRPADWSSSEGVGLVNAQAIADFGAQGERLSEPEIQGDFTTSNIPESEDVELTRSEIMARFDAENPHLFEAFGLPANP